MRALGVLREFGAWPVRRWRYASTVVVLALVARQLGSGPLVTVAVAALVGPAVVGVWSSLWPGSFEPVVAGPCRRWSWRRWAQRNWESLARDCDLALLRRDPGDRLRNSLGSPSSRAPRRWVSPRLVTVATCGDVLTLTIRVRPGQTVDELEDAAPAIAAAADAVSFRVRSVSPSAVELALVLRDTLASSMLAAMPGSTVQSVDELVVGRRQDGSPWALPLRGRHTLVVGCSGAGKGSILWGIVGGLGPAVSADVVRLWGVDLKRGVELGIGQGLFHTTAYTPADAMTLLGQLLAVIDVRGGELVGRSRLHEPVAGDPLHVLVIDELAALLAYADPDTRRDASRLLSEILTQGRALGVVVLALVQDPRKETVGQRGLFTQTVALRLRSAEETRMVLGDGMAAVAPAHRISPTAPGTGYVVGDDGTVDLVRAHWWSDQLVRQVAATHPARVRATVGVEQDCEPVELAAPVPIAARPRKPRSPRTPRQVSAAVVVGDGEVSP